MRAPFEEVRNQRRVLFGFSARDAVARTAAERDARRVALVVSPRGAAAASTYLEALGNRAGGVIALARPHVPAEAVAEAVARVRELGADSIVAVGGGSPIGLGKALRLDPSIDLTRAFIAVPTTYAGSEMTSIYGIREGGTKRVGIDPRVAPDVVIYDPALTAGLPTALAVASLFNALAHAVDSLYAPGATPLLAAHAERAIATVGAALSRPDAIEDALFGAYLASAILGGDGGSTGMALQHKLAHVVAGTFELPHAETHAVLLPHVIAFNHAAAPEVTALCGRALSCADPAGHLYDRAARAALPMSLGALGLTLAQAHQAAATIAAAPVANVWQPTRSNLAELLERAHRGDRPTAVDP
ncbi:MAG TPA: iron-containing alcohol dehydrogenase [Kofleriaceae bacterium]|nr:iron-containing alcohol dehydrogenase [Kofleriaceae bacterium]